MKTVRKFHGSGCKNGYFTSSGVAMLDHGCGVSQYLQIYSQHLENHQLLPRPYLWIFEGGIGGK